MKRTGAKLEIYEHIARVGKALSSSNRLELLDLLCQGEKTVETLAEQAELNVKITSAHLKVLKAARLIENQRSGRYIYYRVADQAVVAFWAKFRDLAQSRLLEIQQLMNQLNSGQNSLVGYNRKTLLRQAKASEVIVIDVRSPDEYASAHLPYSRSLPLQELKKKLSTLDPKKEIVAYCRGPYCVLSHQAVDYLKSKGFRASKIDDGVSDWVAAGLPIEQGKGRVHT